jgi:hypothetical protein
VLILSIGSDKGTIDLFESIAICGGDIFRPVSITRAARILQTYPVRSGRGHATEDRLILGEIEVELDRPRIPG